MLRNNKFLATGAGAALGIGKTIFDSDDDNFATTSLNTIIGAQLGYMSNELVDYLMTKTKIENKKQKKEARLNSSQQESRAMVKDKVTSATGETTKIKANAQAEATLKAHANTQKYKKALMKVKTIGKFGLGAFALATLLDLNERAERKIRAEEMVKQQEKNVRRKIRQLSDQSKRHSSVIEEAKKIGGEMVFELFNERIGHYKMGNAKFQ